MDAQKGIIAVEEFNGKHKINENYRPIAESLKAKFRELEYVPVKNILFIENTEDKRKKNNSTVYAQISKIPPKFEEIIYQVTGKYFEYMLEIFKENTYAMSREQIVALIYHELRHIQLVQKKDGSEIDIVGHDVEDWLNMVEKLGLNWQGTMSQIPDLLGDGVNWESIEGPMNLFPAETSLKLVK
ncbi:MAG: putative metallopeptidase [Desulfitobacterium hafniense]|nr:putative metallopeptidase [Desulfitobacterium hafniense]